MGLFSSKPAPKKAPAKKTATKKAAAKTVVHAAPKLTGREAEASKARQEETRLRAKARNLRYTDRWLDGAAAEAQANAAGQRARRLGG